MVEIIGEKQKAEALDNMRAKEFAKGYDELCKKHGFMIQPIVQPNLQIVKLKTDDNPDNNTATPDPVK